MNKRAVLILTFLICLWDVYAVDIKITNRETEGFFNADFNRTFIFNGGFSETEKIEFNDRLAFKGGVSLGWSKNVTEIKLFTDAAFRILSGKPFEVKLAWIYKGLPEYETRTHTVVPFLSWDAKNVGVTAGMGFRFSSFYGERALFELLLPIKVYWNFINNEKICVGMSIANFDDFSADSFIAFALAANVSVNINEQWSILNELAYKNSGVDGLTAAFHGITLKTGVRFTW